MERKGLRITVEVIGLPELKKALGARQKTIETRGSTLGDLLEALESSVGLLARKSLRNDKGNIQDIVQVIRNGSEWLPRDDLGVELREGDKITFLLMVAGG